MGSIWCSIWFPSLRILERLMECIGLFKTRPAHCVSNSTITSFVFCCRLTANRGTAPSWEQTGTELVSSFSCLISFGKRKSWQLPQRPTGIWQMAQRHRKCYSSHLYLLQAQMHNLAWEAQARYQQRFVKTSIS